VLSIDPLSATPPFEQLRMQLLRQVHAGDLVPGAKLPTVRRLAQDLALAPNTVARTYRELEAAGIIETRGRNGTFVRASENAAEHEAQLAARAFADRIHQLGIPRETALAFATAALY
jgi:DNA-binding transcriptional regulator YhcF (GntR family)